MNLDGIGLPRDQTISSLNESISKQQSSIVHVEQTEAQIHQEEGSPVSSQQLISNLDEESSKDRILASNSLNEDIEMVKG